MIKENQKVNVNNPAIRRILGEYKELQKEPSDQYKAFPMEDNLFEWHFTIRGPKGTDFEGGIYHGKILLPSEYPYKPPDFVFLTPNGRFVCGEKICLTVSAYHPEQWQPSWSMRTALLAIIGFMPTKGEGAIGALDYTPDERKLLAKRSWSYTCNRCGTTCATALPPEEPSPVITTPVSTETISTTPDVNNNQEKLTARTIESETVHVVIPQNQPTQQEAQPQVPQQAATSEWIEFFKPHRKLLDYLAVLLVVLIIALILRKF